MRAALQLPPGLANFGTPYASKGRWFDGNLVRWRQRVPQPVGGWSPLDGLLLPEAARAMISWRDREATRWLGLATTTGLYAWHDGELLDLLDEPWPAGDLPGLRDGFGIGDYGDELFGTPRELPDSPANDLILGDWTSLDNYGEDLLAVATQDGHLLRWKPSTPTVKAAIVPGAPLASRIVVTTAERHVMLLGAGGNPRRVAWCSQENPEDWTPTNLNTAGGFDLETESEIVAAALVPEGVLVLTMTDAHLIRYVGVPYVYGRQRVGDGCGAIGPNVLVPYPSGAAWFSGNGFFRFSSGVAPIGCDIQDYIQTRLSRDLAPRSFATVFGQHDEVWWFWPSGEDEECDRYAAWNFRDNHFTGGRMGRTAGDYSTALMRPLLATLDGRVMQHEVGWLADGQSRLGEVYLESGALEIGAGDTTVRLRDVFFDDRPVNLKMVLKASWEADGPERVLGPIGPARADGMATAREAFRHARVRLEPTSDGPWKMGVGRLDLVPAGRR